MQVGIIGGHGTEYGLSFRPCVSERREASGALKRTYLTVRGGRRIALSSTFTAMRGMSRIAHSITSGSPLVEVRKYVAEEISLRQRSQEN